MGFVRQRVLVSHVFGERFQDDGPISTLSTFRNRGRFTVPDLPQRDKVQVVFWHHILVHQYIRVACCAGAWAGDNCRTRSDCCCPDISDAGGVRAGLRGRANGMESVRPKDHGPTEVIDKLNKRRSTPLRLIPLIKARPRRLRCWTRCQ